MEKSTNAKKDSRAQQTKEQRLSASCPLIKDTG